MAETDQEKTGANASEADAPAPLPLKKWRKTPDDLEGLRRYQWRALRAAETAMYAAAEDGDRAGVVKASNQLSKAVGGFRKLLTEQRQQEREDARTVTLQQLQFFQLDVVERVKEVFRAHSIPREVQEAVAESLIGDESPAAQIAQASESK